MTDQIVRLGPEYFPRVTTGVPISAGSIYIGEPDTDPEIVGNQITVNALQENGSTVAISQPILTSGGGIPLYNGSPVTLSVSESYSLKVLDSFDVQIYYVPSTDVPVPDAAESSVGYLIDLLALINVSSPVENQTETVLSFFDGLNQGGDDFYWDSSVNKNTANGGTIIDPDNIGGFDGTVGTLSTFLSAQGGGVGFGCWVRNYTGAILFDWFGAIGDGAQDDIVALTAAEQSLPATGGTLKGSVGRTYAVNTDFTITKDNTRVTSDDSTNCIIFAPDASSISNAVVKVATGLSGVQIDNITIDGNSDNNDAAGFACIYAIQTEDIIISDCVLKNGITEGIRLFATTSANKNFAILNNSILNVGRAGIDVDYGQQGLIDGNKIISTGGSGIGLSKGSDAALYFTSYCRVVNNYITKEVPPTSIYLSGAEGGFFIAMGEGTKFCTIDSNICYDNRNASQDGIGYGQTGADTVRGMVISNNQVLYAGQFGIDCTSETVCDGNIVRYPAEHGIAIVSDAGDDFQSVVVTNNIITNVNESNNVIADIYAILVNALVACDFTKLIISDNVIYDSRITPQTDYGIGLVTTNAGMNSVQVRNNDVNDLLTAGIRVVGANISEYIIAGNIGYSTRTRGVGAVANGNTFHTVVHGLDVTPLVQDITITGAADSTNPITRVWVDNINSTQFRVNTGADPGASGWSFGWTADTESIS